MIEDLSNAFVSLTRATGGISRMLVISKTRGKQPTREQLSAVLALLEAARADVCAALECVV